MHVMEESDRPSAVFAGGLVFTAVLCRFLAPLVPFSEVLVFLRPIAYLTLYACWGISIRSRIIQKQAQAPFGHFSPDRVLVSPAYLKEFNVVSSDRVPNLVRWIWYAYYIPMMYIPLLAVLVAMSLGKPENSRLPDWSMWLFLPTSVLCLLVVTNDLH